MKVVRAIKIIAFIVAIIALLVTAAGNFFIAKDAIDYKDQSIDVAAVKAALDEYEFKLSSLKTPFKTASAEEEVDETGAFADITDEDLANEEDAFFPGEEVDPDYVEPSDEEPVEEEPEESYELANDLPTDGGAYALEAAHGNAVIGLMKAANWFWTDKVATETEFKGSAVFGDPNPDFTVNALLTIAFGCIVLAFILHLISKNVKKTFYGILLMILGFIIFVVLFALGIVIGNCVSLFDASLLSDDLGFVRICIVAGFTFLAVLFGLPYVRCGSRQMKIKDLKNRIKKLRAKKKMAD